MQVKITSNTYAHFLTPLNIRQHAHPQWDKGINHLLLFYWMQK